MSKLISNPLECGLRHRLTSRLGNTTPYCFCKHKSVVAGALHCDNDKVFPTNCPLQDGEPSVKNVITNIPFMPTDVYGPINWGKPKRRNRKDCYHYEGNTNRTLSEPSCSAPFMSLICSGVNCGKFDDTKKVNITTGALLPSNPKTI